MIGPTEHLISLLKEESESLISLIVVLGVSLIWFVVLWRINVKLSSRLDDKTNGETDGHN